MICVAVSDTHNQAEAVPIPEGDVLIHAGDLTMQGSPVELVQAARWLGSIRGRFRAVIAIPGNHDFVAQRNPLWAKALFQGHGVTLLIDEPRVVDGVKFYGSPWQPWFYDWAFNFPKADDGKAARKKWAEIPHDTDVLVTHGPPYGILDKTFGGEDTRVGCAHLLEAIQRRRLQAHVFGHIHESFGTELYRAEDGSEIRFVNAAICDRAKYAAIQPPVVFEVKRVDRAEENENR
jgi:Icc-related predicted phosphoesterase